MVGRCFFFPSNWSLFRGHAIFFVGISIITIYDVYFILFLGVFLYRELGDLHPHQVVRSEYEDLQRSGNATFENSQMVGFFSWFGEATKRPRASCGGFLVYIYTLIIYRLYIYIHIFFPTLWKVKIDCICFLDQCLMGLEDCSKGWDIGKESRKCNDGVQRIPAIVM